MSGPKGKTTIVQLPVEELVCWPCGRLPLVIDPTDKTRALCTGCGLTYATEATYTAGWLNQ